VLDPAANGRRATIGVGHRKARLPERVTVPIGKKAGALYLLHTAGGIGPSDQAAAVTFTYEDGSEETTVLLNNRHLVGWWFPKTAHHPIPQFADSGVAWEGPNPRSNAVGVCWTALPNPQPEKTIASLTFTAALDGATYALLAITLADLMAYKEAELVSHGGPDNWSAGTIMLGLIEGLCGVSDAPRTTALSTLVLSPRWAASEAKDVSVTTRYAASDGYVAYRYRHDSAARRLTLELTGKSGATTLRVLLPAGVTAAQLVTVDGETAEVRYETVETSTYAVATVDVRTPVEMMLAY